MSVNGKRSEIASALRVLLIGAALGLAVLAWTFFARGGDEKISSNGFSEGGASGGAPPFAFDRRSPTSLSFVSRSVAVPPSSVRTEDSPASPSPAAADGASAARAAPDAPVVPSPPAAARKPASDPDADAAAKRDLAAGGLPTDPKGLSEIGFKKRMLMVIAAKMMDHPAVVKALFNNKYVVDTMMNRDDVKRACSDQTYLGYYISSPAASQPMFQMLRGALSDPSSAADLAQTDLVTRVAGCPSLQAAAQNPSGMASLALANPSFMELLTDPRAVQALSGNPAAMAQFNSAQSSMSGGSTP